MLNFWWKGSAIRADSNLEIVGSLHAELRLELISNPYFDISIKYNEVSAYKRGIDLNFLSCRNVDKII